MERSSGLGSRLWRELVLAILLLTLGLMAVPSAVYQTGSWLLGPYDSGSGGMGTFYADLLAALAEADPGVWLLVLSPWLCVLLLRAARAVVRAKASPPASRSHRKPTRRTPRRRTPHIDGAAGRA